MTTDDLNARLERIECDHDWKWISDWGGDPDVVGGTFDCSRWECLKCGIVDTKREPPGDPDEP